MFSVISPTTSILWRWAVSKCTRIWGAIRSSSLFLPKILEPPLSECWWLWSHYVGVSDARGQCCGWCRSILLVLWCQHVLVSVLLVLYVAGVVLFLAAAAVNPGHYPTLCWYRVSSLTTTKLEAWKLGSALSQTVMPLGAKWLRRLV